MVAYQVIGNDTAVMLAAQSGQLESNVLTPLIIHNILQSMDLIKNALVPFNHHCVAGITANAARCKEVLESTEAPLVALAHYLGLERAKEIVEEAQDLGKSLKQAVSELDLLPKDQIDKILGCKSLTQPSQPNDTTGSGT